MYTFHFSVHCQYENSAFLEVLSQPSVLSPGKSSEVDILFYPRECKHYHDVIPFEINGLSVMSVDILGQGTEIKVLLLFEERTSHFVCCPCCSLEARCLIIRIFFH